MPLSKVKASHTINLHSAEIYNNVELPVFEIINYTETGKYESSDWAVPVEYAEYILGDSNLEFSPLGSIELPNEDRLELMPLEKLSSLLVRATASGNIPASVVLQKLTTSILRKEKIVLTVEKKEFKFYPSLELLTV